MPITLLCLVKGNTSAHAFAVDIDGSKLVSHLKKVIKAEKQNDFADVDADKLKLWKVTIPDDQDDLLSNLSLQDQTELLATKKISKYFPDPPAEEHIHVIVESPASTVTSNREQELLDELASLKALLNKSVYEFDVIVSPKQTRGFKWTVNINHATLENLKENIYATYQTPALENPAVVFNFVNDGGRYLPRNDDSFREMLRSLVSKSNHKFTVFIETPSKPFSEWTFPKVCELYGLSNDPNPSIKVFPVFSCGCVDLKDEKSQAVVSHLMTGLKLLQDITPLDMAYEATKSIYSYCYLIAGVILYRKNLKVGTGRETSIMRLSVV